MATGVFDSLAQIRTREIRDDVTLIVVTPEPLLSSLGGGATSLTVARRLLIVGRVQGVGFRAAARRQALALGLCGWVRNLPDGRVEAWAEGDAAAVKAFEDWCRQGPPAARVDRVEAEDAEPARHASFFIR
ncbi:MAG: acylphosphatase [Firmicutes bacterium]|nr:acylphosphatase [Bacillota bacterium]